MVTTAALRTHVDRLAADIGERNVFRPSGLAAAREYITSEWQNQGYRVAAYWYDVRGLNCANLKVTRRGSAEPQQILLVGAHYDSISGSPGANDNASSVAALLELPRLFATVTPRVTLRFVAFVNEEPPFFFSRRQGSLIYALNARQQSDNIRLMMSLDSIGYYIDQPGSQHYPPFFRYFYPDRGNFLGLVSDFRSASIARRLAGLFRAHSDFPFECAATFHFVPGAGWSDHLSFWRTGFRALMVTDTAFYRYPFYHSADDTPDKLTYPQFAQAISGLFMALSELAVQGFD